MGAGHAATVAAAGDARRQRAEQLGFASVEDYLRTRYVAEGRGLGSIARELGASHRMVQRLLVAMDVTIRSAVIAAQDRERAGGSEVRERREDERVADIGA